MYRQLSGLLLDDTCRGVVRTLRDDGGPIPETELVQRLVAGIPELGDPPRGVVASLARQLYRHHLPALVENGLVHWDEGEGTVASTYHPLYHREQPAELVVENSLDSLAAVLTDPRRREILACLHDEPGPVGCRDLARRVASMEATGPPEQFLIEAVTTSLQDTHLRRLAAFALLEHDAGEATVTYRGPRELTAVLHRRHSPHDQLSQQGWTVARPPDGSTTDGNTGV